MENERKCEKCGKTHVDVAKVEKEEMDSLSFLENRIVTARKWVQEGKTQEVVSAAMQLEADSLSQERQWWQEMASKYKFDIDKQEIYPDFILGVLYYNKD